MQLARLLFAPVAASLLALGAPASAQSQADRDMYQPMFDLALHNLGREREAITELQQQLQRETDLVRGCATLDQTLVHLRTADTLLSQMHNYAERLRRRAQISAVEAQQALIREEIGLKEGDIARMCQGLSG